MVDRSNTIGCNLTPGLVGGNAPDLALTPPVPGPVLLHACCAPCSGAVLECLVQNGIKPIVFFSNSNIVPLEEYQLRKEELIRYCELWNVEFVDDDYDHSDWLACVAAGREDAPERGPRCLECFKYRLFRAAQYAMNRGCTCLTTTLASSRWKSLEQVNEAGLWAVQAAQTSPTVPGIHPAPATPATSALHVAPATPTVPEQPSLSPVLHWWGQNWRKGGLQPRRSEIIREMNFYNQPFCGCEFSKGSRP